MKGGARSFVGREWQTANLQLDFDIRSWCKGEGFTDASGLSCFVDPLVAMVPKAQSYPSNFMSRLQATSAALKPRRQGEYSSNILACTTDASLHNHSTP